MQAILFIGTQATGKSTFYQQTFFHTHLRINLDMLKTRHREKQLITACLQTKQPFVIDNTNPTSTDRARYIQPAREHGFQITGYYFQSRIEDALKYNTTRPTAQRIPQRGIRATHAKLQLPQYNEGFHTLYYVRHNPMGGFDIKEWKNEV